MNTSFLDQDLILFNNNTTTSRYGCYKTSFHELATTLLTTFWRSAGTFLEILTTKVANLQNAPTSVSSINRKPFSSLVSRQPFNVGTVVVMWPILKPPETQKRKVSSPEKKSPPRRSTSRVTNFRRMFFQSWKRYMLGKLPPQLTKLPKYLYIILHFIYSIYLTQRRCFLNQEQTEIATRMTTLS